MPHQTALLECTPTKVGSTSMHLLLGYISGNMWGHGARGTVELFSQGCAAGGGSSDGGVEGALRVQLFVRNPYERLLSAFLGQVAAGAGQRDANAAAQLQVSFGRNGSHAPGRCAPAPL